METGIEEDLVRLLTKIQNKNLEDKKLKGPNTIDVKVENLYDIKGHLEILNNLKEKNEKEKEEIKKSLEERKFKYEKMNDKIHSRLKSIRIKNDEIIDKNNKLSKELNDKKNEEIKQKSNYEMIKSEMDSKNEKLNISIKNFRNQFEKKNEEIVEFEKKISNIYHLLKSQRDSKNEYLLQMKEQKHIDNEIFLNSKMLTEEESDKKFFDIINSNISKEAKQINLSSIESNLKVQNLRKITFDNENLKKLEIEKDQQHEYSREYNIKIKEFLKTHENIENDIKDLMIKKNKLKDEIMKREIESNLKKNDYRNDINDLTNNIKNIETEMLNNIKEQKKVNLILFLLILIV